MFTGILEFDLLLGDVHSLKEKRSVVRPLISAIQRKWPVSAAECGYQDLHRRSLIGVAVVSSEGGHCDEVLSSVEQLVVDHPEVEILGVRHRLIGPDD